MRVLDRDEFTKSDGCWVVSPPELNGSILKIESEEVTPALIERVNIICKDWEDILSTSKSYIEAQRQEYNLSSKSFVNPNVFVESYDEWAVYFDTESESESVVGVEFKHGQPFELTVGDWGA